MSFKKQQRSAFDEALSHPLLPSASNISQSKDHKSNYGYLPLLKRNNDHRTTLPYQSTFIDESNNPFAKDDNLELRNEIGLELEQEQMSQFHGTDFDSALVIERNLEITTINQSMRQIHDIQKDLAALVDHQQEDIDDVEENAIETHGQAERALNDLEKAAIFLKTNKRTSKKCVVFVIVFCLFILLFGIKHLKP